VAADLRPPQRAKRANEGSVARVLTLALGTTAPIPRRPVRASDRAIAALEVPVRTGLQNRRSLHVTHKEKLPSSARWSEATVARRRLGSKAVERGERRERGEGRED
jgi:hypothetical protein